MKSRIISVLFVLVLFSGCNNDVDSNLGYGIYSGMSKEQVETILRNQGFEQVKTKEYLFQNKFSKELLMLSYSAPDKLCSVLYEEQKGEDIEFMESLGEYTVHEKVRVNLGVFQSRIYFVTSDKRYVKCPW